MARKKKKKQKKQQIQQRRAKMSQKRSKRRPSAIPPSPVDPPQPVIQSATSELIRDLQPLLSSLSSQQGLDTRKLLQMVLETGVLSQEPEFKEFLLSPIDCVNLFVASADELGIKPEMLVVSPESESLESQNHIFDKSLKRLLTDEIRQIILDKLDQLRQRARASKLTQVVGQAAITKSILQDKQYRDMWPAIGLLRTLFLESLEIGFELMAILGPLMSAPGETPDLFLQQRVHDPDISQKIMELTDKYPKLEIYLNSQADEMWESSQMSLFSGELYLGLFTDSELEALFPAYEEMIVALEERETLDGQKEAIPRFANQAKEYLDQLLTPERVAKIKQDVAQFDESGQSPSEKLASLVMLKSAVTNPESTVDDIHPILMKALLGELVVKYSAVMEEDQD